MLGALGSQANYDPGKDLVVAPALPTAIEGLRLAVFLRRITPPKTIAIYEYYAAANTTVIDVGLP